jgi:hypothetical protein
MVPGYETGFEGNANPNYPVTIASSTQTSSAITCGGFTFCGVIIPSVFTGTVISFEHSVDGVSYFPVYSTNSGTLLTYTVTPGTYCAVDPKDFYGVSYLIIKSGSSEAATRTLIASLKGF